MRRRGRVDATQEGIVAALRSIGAAVLSLAPMGHGCPDLLVFYRRRLFLLECKSPGGSLTDDQFEFAKRWPVFVVTTPEDAIASVTPIRPGR